MGSFWWLAHFQILGIMSNIGDAVSKFFGTGDYDATKIQNAYNTLDNVRPYLHFNDAVGQIFNWVKWGLLKGLYNLANAAQQVSTEALDYRKLLSSAGIKEQYQGYVLGAATAVMTGMLIWIGVKYMLGKEKLGVQHIIMQVVISVFLMLNISTITNWVAEQASGFYSDAISEKNGNKYSNSIPFDLVAKNTNDLMYMYASNWKGYGTKDNGKIKTQYREHFGNNGWLEDGKATDDGQDMFEQLSANDLAMSITPDQADIMQKELDKYAKKHGWATEKVRPEYLKYRLVDGGDKPAAIKIGKYNIPFSNAFKGGYSRYTVAALPVGFCLGCLAFAFFFITYLIIKTFLDMAIMQIIGVVVFSSDLESGQKTKAVVQDIFTSAITLCCQAVELMFYRIAADWIISQDFHSKGMTGIVVECMGFLALTIMLISGSQKTTKFFGVDTGAQKGFTAAALAVNQTMGAIQKGGRAIKGAGTGVAKVAKGSYDFAMDTGAKATGAVKGLNKLEDRYNDAKDQAKRNGTPMKLSDKIGAMGAGALAGYHTAKAERDTRKEFMKAGGSRMEWAAGTVRGLTQAPVEAKAARYDANGMKDSAYDALRGQIDPYPSAVRDQNENKNLDDKPEMSHTQAVEEAKTKGQSVKDVERATSGAQEAAEKRNDEPKAKYYDETTPRKMSEDNDDQKKISDGRLDKQETNTKKPDTSTSQGATKQAQTDGGQEIPKTAEERKQKPVESDEKAKIKNPAIQKQETEKLSEHSSTKGSENSAQEPAKKSENSTPISQVPANDTNRKLSDKVETKSTSTQKPEVKSSYKPTSAPQTPSEVKTAAARQKGDRTEVKVQKEPNEVHRSYQDNGATKLSENRKVANSKGRSLEEITKGKQVVRTKNLTEKGDQTKLNIHRQNEVSRNIEDTTKINDKINQATRQNTQFKSDSMSKPRIKQAPKHEDFKGKDK